MKVLVTGATGFIGGHVIEELLKRGHTVVASALRNPETQKQEWEGKVSWFPLDLSELNNTYNYFDHFQRPDLMIHLAWEGLPNYTAAFHEEINLPRHITFLKNLVSNGLRSLTVAGTCLEYGMQEGALSEDLPSMPGNPYARAKDRLRKEMESLKSSIPFSFKWVRLFYMYGKGQNPNSLLSQLEKAIAEGKKTFPMSGGQQLRDYLPVEKVANYLVSIALQERVDGIINCCSGVPVTVESFVRDYLKERNVSVELELGVYPYPVYEPMKFWGETKKLNKIINHE